MEIFTYMSCLSLIVHNMACLASSLDFFTICTAYHWVAYTNIRNGGGSRDRQDVSLLIYGTDIVYILLVTECRIVRYASLLSLSVDIFAYALIITA